MQAHNLAVQEPRVEEPIFIVGTGRCGSTAFHRALATHAQTAWFSRLCETRPHDPRANRRMMQILGLPLPARYLRKFIYPVEAYQFWERYCPGFSEPCRDLLKEDVTLSSRRRLQHVMAQMLTPKRNRLLARVTGWPRIGFLEEVFPDARFIHLYRDGRAVANSFLGVSWWSGWRGPGRWRWGELSPEHRDKWEGHHRSFVALAAVQWEILMSAHKEAKQRISSKSLLEIRYEDMCKDPLGTFQLAAEFSELEWSPRFTVAIQGLSFVNTNSKWQEQLSAGQQRVLNECLFETLREYGYV